MFRLKFVNLGFLKIKFMNRITMIILSFISIKEFKKIQYENYQGLI